jgi:hypothetical protein
MATVLTKGLRTERLVTASNASGNFAKTGKAEQIVLWLSSLGPRLEGCSTSSPAVFVDSKTVHVCDRFHTNSADAVIDAAVDAMRLAGVF